MKAIVYDAPRKFEYRDIAVPKIQPDEILLRVHACGVCGKPMVQVFMTRTGTISKLRIPG